MAIVEVTEGRLDRFCEFLCTHQVAGMSKEELRARLVAHKGIETKPNYGFMLLSESDEVVGAIGALYAQRQLDGKQEILCHSAHWFVKPEHRKESMHLLFRLLGQPGMHFVNLTGAQQLTPISLALGFKPVDQEKVVLSPLFVMPPWRPWVRVYTNPQRIARRLDPDNRKILDDHVEINQLRHVLIQNGTASCYCVFLRQKRKKIPFAVPLYFSNPELFYRYRSHFLWAFFRGTGTPLTLVGTRFVTESARLCYRIHDPRPWMFRSPTLREEHIDGLYSELTL